MFAAMETADDWIDAETWKKGWEVEWDSLAKWRRECELKFSPPPKPPSVWSRIGDGLEVAALWLVLLVVYFCVIIGAVFWSCGQAARKYGQADSCNFARRAVEEHLL